MCTLVLMGFSDTSERFWKPIDFIIGWLHLYPGRVALHCILSTKPSRKIITLQRLKSLQDKVNRFQLLQVSLGLAFCVWIHFMMKFLISKSMLFHRYLGTTPNASSLACLLYSICQQLSYTFMLPFEHIPNDIVPLTAHLKGC